MKKELNEILDIIYNTKDNPKLSTRVPGYTDTPDYKIRLYAVENYCRDKLK